MQYLTVLDEESCQYFLHLEPKPDLEPKSGAGGESHRKRTGSKTLWTEKYLCQILVHPQQPAATWSPTAAPSGAHASKPVLTMVNTI